MNYIKIKNFCLPEDNIKRVEEDIFFLTIYTIQQWFCIQNI